LTQRLIAGLRRIAGVTIHGIINPNRSAERVPTVSFTHDKTTTHKIAQSLAAAGIYVWSGHNYAYEVVRHLGINEKEGVVRVGIAHYNSEAEVERCLASIAEIVR